MSEFEASASAAESKLRAAAAEQRAAEAKAESLQRELAASEGRLEESARLLASNQQVIKWLNKELNDAQMVPGGASTAAAAVLAGAGAVFGGLSSSSPPRGENLTFEDYNFVGAEITPARVANTNTGGERGVGSGGKENKMFTAGLRESLAGGVHWDLRGTTLDGDDQNRNRNDGYSNYRGETVEDGQSRVVVEGTPDHAGRGNEYGRAGGAYSRIVTPESAGVSDSVQASSSRRSSGDGKRGEDEYTGDNKDDGLGGDAIRGIRAY